MKQLGIFSIVFTLGISIAYAQVNKLTSQNLLNNHPEDSNHGILSALEIQDFEEKVLSQTEDLGQYLKIIAGKNSSYQDIKTAIDLACGLFVNENARVEVSSGKKQAIASYKIREYLERLKLLHYDQVEIQWYEIGYVSQLRQDPDGRYYGTVTISQRFKGISDGKPVYEDITTKHIQVVLERLELDKDKKEHYWDVRLGDISVVETI
jgi:hypothetical protein